MGNARTALFCALLAAKVGGDFVLRSEDTDAVRSHESHLESQIEDLRWLGLKWSEGPDCGGGHGPYRQSERLNLYAGYFDKLLAEGRVYPCFCTPETLAVQRAGAIAAGRAPRYAGTCARLSPEQARGRLLAGEPASLRFRVPAGRVIVFTDLVKGEQRVALDDIGDFIVRRAEGRPAFFFANAIDDALMAITHVLRGEDHLSNTPRQLLLFEALGHTPPHYGHLPLVLGRDGRPLAKRSGGGSLEDLRRNGILPAAVLNHLMRLGHAPTSSDLLDWHGLVGEFDLGRIGRAPAQHDPEQLAHWQRLAIRALDPGAAARWIGTAMPAERWARLWRLVQGNVESREDAIAWARGLAEPPNFDAAARAAIAAVPPNVFVIAAKLSLEPDGGNAVRHLQASAGVSGALLFHSLRAALTGHIEGPEVARLWSYFTPDDRRRRFEQAARLRGS